jgi:hypothetical protein
MMKGSGEFVIVNRPPADVVFDTSLTDVFCFTDATSNVGPFCSEVCGA